MDRNFRAVPTPVKVSWKPYFGLWDETEKDTTDDGKF
jgi:hypothetical protein